MARTPTEKSECAHSESPETLAEVFFYVSDPVKRREIEKYRIDFEAVHGPTDLTKRYTSMWPDAQRDWLVKHDIKRYFDGLPPFAKAYLKRKMQLVARDGRLDNMPDDMLRLFVSGQMRLDHESHSR